MKLEKRGKGGANGERGTSNIKHPTPSRVAAKLEAGSSKLGMPRVVGAEIVDRRSERGNGETSNIEHRTPSRVAAKLEAGSSKLGMPRVGGTEVGDRKAARGNGETSNIEHRTTNIQLGERKAAGARREDRGLRMARNGERGTSNIEHPTPNIQLGENDVGGAELGDGYLDKEEVARRLGLRPRTVGLWAQDGRLPAFRFGRYLRFKWDEVEQAIASKCRVKSLGRDV